MKSKKQIILLMGGCLLIALVVAWFLIIPLFGTIKQISSELAGVKRELAIMQNKAGEIRGVEDVCSKIDPDLAKMESFFVNKEVPIRVIEFLESTADNSNISIKISPISLKGYKDEAWDFVAFRLDLLGSYAGFMEFLTKIETGPFLIEAYNLSIKEATSELLQDNINAILTIKIFAN